MKPMNRWVTILYVAFSFVLLFFVLLITWSLAYSNHYVKQIETILETKDFERLLKNYEAYIPEPVFIDQTESFEIRAYHVVGLRGAEELEVVREPVLVFYLTTIDETKVDLSKRGEPIKLEISCPTATADWNHELRVMTDVFHAHSYLSFEIYQHLLSDACTDPFTLTLYDQQQHVIYTRDQLSFPYTVEDIKERGKPGYNLVQTFQNIFPVRVAIPTFILFVLYIVIFRFIWKLIKRGWYAKQNKRNIRG